MMSAAEERLSLLSAERKLLLFMLQKLHSHPRLPAEELLPLVNGDHGRLDRLVQTSLLLRFEGQYVLPVEVRRMLRPEQPDTWADAACNLADLVGQLENRLSLADPDSLGLQDNLWLIRNALEQDLESRYLDWHHIRIFARDEESQSVGKEVLSSRLQQDHENLDKLNELLSVHPWVRSLIDAQLISMVLMIREQILEARRLLRQLETMIAARGKDQINPVHLIKALRDRQQLERHSNLNVLLQGDFPDGSAAIQTRPSPSGLRILKPSRSVSFQMESSDSTIAPIRTPDEKHILTPDWDQLWKDFCASGQDLFSFIMKLHWHRSLGPEIRLQWFLRMHQLYADQLDIQDKWVELYGHRAREIRAISDSHTDPPAKAQASQKKNSRNLRS